jgi:hypothetical protein
MNPQIINIDQNLKKLNPEQLTRLFDIFKNNSDIFSKLFPGAPLFQLIETGAEEQARSIIHNMSK